MGTRGCCPLSAVDVDIAVSDRVVGACVDRWAVRRTGGRHGAAWYRRPWINIRCFSDNKDGGSSGGSGDEQTAAKGEAARTSATDAEVTVDPADAPAGSGAADEAQEESTAEDTDGVADDASAGGGAREFSADLKAAIAAANAVEGEQLLFRSTRKLTFQALGGFSVVQAVFWTYIAYEQYFYPEILDLSQWWTISGYGLAAACIATGQFVASHTVKSVTLTQHGSHARLVTFNLVGTERPGVEVPVPLVSQQSVKEGYVHLKIGESKGFLLCDMSGELVDPQRFDNVINGRVVLEGDKALSGKAAEVAARKAKRRRGGRAADVQWVPATDEGTGRTYWYHPKTRETSWINPADPQGLQSRG